MRNLELFLKRINSGCPGLGEIHDISIDVDTGKIYGASNDTLYCVNTDGQKVEWQICLKDHELLTEEGDRILNIQHLPDVQSVAIATSNGDVLLLNTLDKEVECVGTVDSGLVNMCWSPDQELLVLATGADTVILMTREFEPVTETSLHPEDFGEQSPVNVGWGKKETQFHGAVGKQAAKQKAEGAGEILPWDDKRVRISWRGDGEFFVTSAVHLVRGFRQLRIWSRECVLQYTSEDVNGLEQALDWKPSGSLIVSSQRLPNRHDIIFFEKNGLRHGEFTLPFKQDEVKVVEVQWNLDSTILAVWLEDLPTGTDQIDTSGRSYVQLWIVSNYHWYLKQSLSFKADERVKAMSWAQEPMSQLHVVCADGCHNEYTWRSVTTTSNGQTGTDHGWAAVIDGGEVLLTPFRSMVVPPPMCAFALQLPTFVSQVAWGPGENSNDIAIILEDNRVALHRLDKDGSTKDDTLQLRAAGGSGFHVRSPLMSCQGIYSIPGGARSHHFTWVRPDTLLAISYSSDNKKSSVNYYKLPERGSSEEQIVLSSSNTIPGLIVSVAAHSRGVIYQLSNGQVIDSDGRLITKLPLPCTQIAYCTMQDKDVVLGLTDRYRFYLNNTEIASDVTSFTVHSEFLLLTTYSHTCKCVRLDQDPTSTSIFSNAIDENVRRVERGSQIVLAVADDTKVILQMPRGNLETIHPRALVLSKIKKCLNKIEFGKAFDLVRRHRISMNILYDHNPLLFSDNLDKFVLGLDTPANINLFIADMKEEDTTQTMYAKAYPTEGTAQKCSSGEGNKTDSVCDALQSALERIDHKKYFLSTLTCLAKKTTPELEKVLVEINNLRHGSCDQGYPTVDEALNYILYLVDVNNLYDIALGTYDFDLVIMVAEKSQKDPKEYLPFLNNLRKMSTDYQKFSIDRHLKRHKKALRHLSNCPDRSEELTQFVEDHALYSTAMDIYSMDSDMYKAISQLYGNHLIKAGKNSEAGLIYSLGGHFEEALEVYKKIGYWQEAITMATRLQQSMSQIHELARSLAVFLKDHRRGSEAATLYLEYCDDPEEAVVALLDAGKWQEASRVIYKYGRADLFESNVKPSVEEAANATLADFDSRRESFAGYKQRLATLREEKRQQFLEFGDDGMNEGGNDLYSETSSITGSMSSSVTSSASQYSLYSQNSRKSGRSVKNRRKADRKKYSLKEGSPHEDIALLEVLGGLIRNTDDMREEIKHLLRALVSLNMTELATRVQRSFSDLLKVMERSISEIWQLDDETNEQIGGLVSGHTMTPTLSALRNSTGTQKKQLLDEMAFMIPPKIERDTKWQLKILDGT